MVGQVQWARGNGEEAQGIIHGLGTQQVSILKLKQRYLRS